MLGRAFEQEGAEKKNKIETIGGGGEFSRGVGHI